jgi:anthraniloyl-CoA monooxygenase
VFETDPETFNKAGLGDMSEEEGARLMERVFGSFLDGHRIQTNRSLWRSFPMIRSKRWTLGNRVLIGDAKATAHFSIGSGTKLAMEDAIALADAFAKERSVEGALKLYETGRREEVEKTQHAADVSLVWFEHVDRFWDFDPVQFAFGVMTRAKAITYDNLRLRAPEFVEEVDRTFARQVKAQGFDVNVERPLAPMFQPFRLRDMVVPNRVVVSPMCMYSAVEGMPTDWHLVHYGSRAIGGPGLLFTEMTCVGRDARITPGCTGLWTDEQEAAWRRIVHFVHANSATKICLQLGHAGPQGATKLMWEGMDRPLEEGGWEVFGASPVPYYPRQPGSPRDEPGRHGPGQGRVRGGDGAGRALRLRHGRAALRPRLPPRELHLAPHQPSAGRVRRAAREPPELPLEVFAAMREAWPNGKADVGAHLGDRLGRGRADRRRLRRGGARLRPKPAWTWSTSRRGRRWRGRGRSTGACSRRPSPTRSATRLGSRPYASATSRRPTR